MAIQLMIARGVALLAAQAPQAQNAFAVPDASRLLNQMRDALVERQAGKFLSAFDLTRMSDGPLFKQQVLAFLSHTDSVRMHYNVTHVTMEGQKGAAVADAEIEADSRDGDSLPLRKQATLRLLAERTPAGWKFTDVQPRAFFSTSSGPTAPAGRGSASQ